LLLLDRVDGSPGVGVVVVGERDQEHASRDARIALSE
jgi:hypothetical protein